MEKNTNKNKTVMKMHNPYPLPRYTNVHYHRRPITTQQPQPRKGRNPPDAVVNDQEDNPHYLILKHPVRHLDGKPMNYKNGK
jgi:hypothetical protein